MPDEEFKLVSKKREGRSTKKYLLKPQAISCTSSGECSITKETALERILSSKQEIVTSDFYSTVVRSFEQGLRLIGNPSIKIIVCYGLGHFAECIGSRYQLGLLLALQEHFSAEIFVHDPIFYPIECELLIELECKVIEENEEGKRTITSTTLAYLPHCPKQLTNNFLWANWGPGLEDCVIFGNSFSNIVESSPKRILTETASCILNINSYVEEIPIVNSFKYTDIFNNTSIHVFPENKIKFIAQEFWDLQEEPKYLEDDTELITKSLKSTLRITN